MGRERTFDCTSYSVYSTGCYNHFSELSDVCHTVQSIIAKDTSVLLTSMLLFFTVLYSQKYMFFLFQNQKLDIIFSTFIENLSHLSHGKIWYQ